MKHDETNNLIWRVIGFNIKTLRKKGKQSQSKFAAMVGMNRTYLGQIENGKRNASVDILIKIADGLDVPLPALFKGLETHAPRNLPKDSTYAMVKLPKEK